MNNLFTFNTNFSLLSMSNSDSKYASFDSAFNSNLNGNANANRNSIMVVPFQ